MKISRSTMGMPAVVEIIDEHATMEDIENVFTYFQQIDNRFSTYKKNSEISQLNAGILSFSDISPDMQEVFNLAEQTKKETQGFFDIRHNGVIDPSGIVKGWALWHAAQQLFARGYKNFMVDIGADIHVAGHDINGNPWRIGIKHPFVSNKIVKVLQLTDKGVATSGIAERGQHIYDPHTPARIISDIVSMTVVGSNVFEADRFATPAFAMGKEGIQFIESIPGLEGYMIDASGVATYTSGFEQYIAHI